MTVVNGLSVITRDVSLGSQLKVVTGLGSDLISSIDFNLNSFLGFLFCKERIELLTKNFASAGLDKSFELLVDLVLGMLVLAKALGITPWIHGSSRCYCLASLLGRVPKPSLSQQLSSCHSNTQ